MGYGKTKQDVLQIVHCTIGEKKVDNGWWVCFCKTWPQLRLRKGNCFPVVRDQMTNYTAFKDNFDLLVSDNGITDKLAQIYNCDESGYHWNSRCQKLLLLMALKMYSSGSKTQDYYSCLCLSIWASNTTNGDIFWQGILIVFWLGVKFRLLCMVCLHLDQESFADWFLYHFLVHAISSRLLLLDGHSSNFTLEFVKLAAEHNVILFCLPPHSRYSAY